MMIKAASAARPRSDAASQPARAHGMRAARAALVAPRRAPQGGTCKPGPACGAKQRAVETRGVAKAALAAATTVDIAALEPVAYLTALSALLYYLCLTINGVMPFVSVIGVTMNAKHENWAVRCFANMTEQWPMFLVGLWTHAIFVSPVTAYKAGCIWLAFRLAYPFVRLFTNENTELTMATTMPQYFVNTYLVTAVVLKLGFGIAPFNPFLAVPVYMCLAGFSMMVLHPVGKQIFA